MLEVNGTPPELDGVVLENIRCDQLWHDRKLQMPVDVVFLQIGGIWYRLFFDHGTIFWDQKILMDQETGEPIVYNDPECQDSKCVTIDLGLELAIAGKKIKSHTAELIGERDSKITFLFEGGGRLTFMNIDDHTTIEHQGL